ncbi:MAG: hypothetical protein OP8BY_2411 [Candidatus Saccharicenans subterraneus]|uniref:Uncharacterized protein n=1 Tax=Candidatus Saccharicenans subterraneus TaxID=2508984 RepID=A0A3E2BJ33_9BACT|nr:MAG: hypothetical protein OP8BY_2411 [Candidatus Saccharicenans subterraneum]
MSSKKVFLRGDDKIIENVSQLKKSALMGRLPPKIIHKKL